MNTEFEEFAVDSRRSPKLVHAAHGSDQITNFLRDSRSSGLTVTDFPRPVPAKSLPMPTKHGFRFDDDQSRPPAGPDPRKPNPQPSIRWTKHRSLFLLSSLQHDYLMAQRDDLCLHRSLSLKGKQRTEHH